MAHGHHEHDGYKPWKNYSIHNQPIHSGETGHKSQAIAKEKNGFLHLGRIDQHFAKLKKEKEENKAIEHLNREQKAKDHKDTLSEDENLEFQIDELKKEKEDLKKGRISIHEFRKRRANVSPDVVPSGTMKGEQSEYDKNRIQAIDTAVNQMNAQIYRINQERKNPDSLYTKADQKGKEEMDKDVTRLGNEIHRLSLEKDGLNNVQRTGFNGIGNQKATENYKGEIIPDDERQNQESAHKSENTARRGESGGVPIAINSKGESVYQKKRHYQNKWGEWVWDNSLSDSKQAKYDRIQRNGQQFTDEEVWQQYYGAGQKIPENLENRKQRISELRKAIPNELTKDDPNEDHDPVGERENFQHNNQVREPSPEAQDTGYVFLGRGVTRN